MLDSLKMLRVDNRVTQLRLNHVHNILYGCAPSYLNSRFSLNENCTRGSSSSNFLVPRIGGSESGSFYYNAILDWNALPTNLSWIELNCLFNVTINDISVIYVTAHRCAGGLKKKYDLRSGSQRHRHFVGFFNVPVLAPTRDQPFYTVIPTHRPI